MLWGILVLAASAIVSGIQRNLPGLWPGKR